MEIKRTEVIMIMMEKEDPRSKTCGFLDTITKSSLKLQSKSHYFEGMVPTATIQELVEEPG